MIIRQKKVAGGISPSLVRFLLFAVFLVSVPLHIPGIQPLIVGDAEAETPASSPDLVSAVSSSPSQTAVPADAVLTGNTGTAPEPETVVDVMHAGLSRSIQGTATWMDSFFGDRRYQSEVNQSYVRFRYNMFFQEGSPFYHKPDLQVRIVLPQLKEKWHLVFAGTPKESTDFSAVNSGAAEEQASTTGGDQRAVAALDRTFLQSAKQNFMVRAGFRLHNYKPVVVLGPRYRLSFPIDSWTLRFIEEVVWTSNVGWATRSTVDLERPLPRNFVFRATTEWAHVEHQLGSTYAVSFILGQLLSSVRALQYEWINVFQTEPVHELIEVDLRVRYRQRLWRDWLYAEVAPQYSFPRNREFRATPGILFRIEMTLGNYAQFEPRPAASP